MIFTLGSSTTLRRRFIAWKHRRSTNKLHHNPKTDLSYRTEGTKCGTIKDDSHHHHTHDHRQKDVQKRGKNLGTLFQRKQKLKSSSSSLSLSSPPDRSKSILSTGCRTTVTASELASSELLYHDHHRSKNSISIEHAMLFDDDESSVSSLFSDQAEEEMMTMNDVDSDVVVTVVESINDQDVCPTNHNDVDDDDSIESFEREYKKMKRMQRELEEQRKHVRHLFDSPTHGRRETTTGVCSVGVGPFVNLLSQKVIPGWLLFEVHHSVHVVVKILLICLAHSFTNELVQTVSRMLFYETSIGTVLGSYRLHLTLQILLGLCMLRLNGNLFHYMDRNELKVVKSELYHRLRNGQFDARFLAAIKGTILCSFVNLIGFYMVYTGISHIPNIEVFPHYFNTFKVWYNRVRDDAASHIPNTTSLVYYGEFDYEWNVNGTNATTMLLGRDDSPEYTTCLILQDYVPHYAQWFFMYLCADPFQEWRLVDLSYQLTWFGIVATFLYQMGTNIFTIED